MMKTTEHRLSKVLIFIGVLIFSFLTVVLIEQVNETSYNNYIEEYNNYTLNTVDYITIKGLQEKPDSLCFFDDGDQYCIALKNGTFSSMHKNGDVIFSMASTYASDIFMED